MLEEKPRRSVNFQFTRPRMPNAYASKICAGKIKDPSGVKRKDFKGPKKAMGGMIDFNKISQGRKQVSSYAQGGIAKGCGAVMASKRKKTKKT